MAIQDYWQYDLSLPDSGGSPVGDPTISTPGSSASPPRARPPKPTDVLAAGSEWWFDEDAWAWVARPIPGYNPTAWLNDPTRYPTEPPPTGYEWAWDAVTGRWYYRQLGSSGSADDRGGGSDGSERSDGGLGTIGDLIYTPTTIRDVGPAPALNAPRYRSPGPFTWEKPKPFVAPDAKAIFDDPGFQARVDMGKRAIQNSESARGASRAGATYKGLIDYAEAMGSQEYGQVYGRRASEYDRAYRNAFEDAVTSYGFLLTDADRRFQHDLAATGAEYQPYYATWQNAADVAKRQAQLDFERERDQTNLNWSREVFGSDEAYRNNALIATILQTIFNQGKPGAP